MISATPDYLDCLVAADRERERKVQRQRRLGWAKGLLRDSALGLVTVTALIAGLIFLVPEAWRLQLFGWY